VPQQAETLAEAPTRTQRPAAARRFQHGESWDSSAASCRGRILSPRFEAHFLRRHAHLTGAPHLPQIGQTGRHIQTARGCQGLRPSHCGSKTQAQH